MEIKNLSLKNFRNYKDLTIEFFNGINIFYGENAQGKTNIIEAIYLFSSSRSHRNAKDKDLIKFGNDNAKINLNFISQTREQQSNIDLFMSKNKKVYINGIEQRVLKALFGVFSTVIFSPEDLFLIKEGPDGRRKFLDTDISQLRPNYFKLCKEYKKVLDLKNNLLKKEVVDYALLDIYNEKLSSLSAEITVHRHQFTMRLSELTKACHYYISDNKEDVEVHYISSLNENYNLSFKEIKEQYLKKYEKNKQKEILKKSCLYGPHRDDLEFHINGKDAKTFASQGQQRSIILSLKLSEYAFMKEVLNESPILLLDDILSELDLKRQEKLLKFIRDNQTIITCTDKDLYKKIEKYPCKIFKVVNGEIIEE